MDGLELVRAVRADEHMRSTKIAMLTSVSAVGAAAALRAAGADAYLAQPVRRAEMISALAEDNLINRDIARVRTPQPQGTPPDSLLQTQSEGMRYCLRTTTLPIE